MSKYRTDSQIPSLPALRAHCVKDVFQRAVIAPPPESLSRRAILERLALLVGGSMLLSEPVAFARNANKPIFADQRSNMHDLPRADRPGATSRPPFSESTDEFAGVPGIPGARFWADCISDFEQALPPESGPWLILSEGGEDGAYGAGVLSGWTKEGSRPVFSVVTGASTGALIAPYAFLGADYDERLYQQYTTVTAADIVELRATRESMFDDWPLASLIAKIITPELLRNIADEHQRGRRLFVVTTNLDAARPVIWNMGVIAAQGGEEGLRLFRQVLLASASIPGMFQPVMIEVQANGQHFQEMHADGGAAAPFYVAPETVLLGGADHRLPASAIYIVINGKLTPEFQITDRTAASILGRSIGVALKAAARAEIMAVHSVARRQGIDVSVAAVAPAFSYETHGPFDTQRMKALFDIGFEQARNRAAFRNQLEPGSASSNWARDGFLSSRSNP
jgi:predicted acylesterase/phospholipase RssA